DADKLPTVVGVDLGDLGYVVARVDAVLPREAGDDVPVRQQYGQAWSAAETRAYLDALKARYKADVRADRVAAAASEPAR
ncbi:MAG TPA: peptidyl-prolyl cis-trans isomerase, partial [Burkholderiaceae bacterium]|nr:peptidyl-prolyl cis-trans isomerase [Burkholderiaceae bacterium]